MVASSDRRWRSLIVAGSAGRTHGAPMARSRAQGRRTGAGKKSPPCRLPIERHPSRSIHCEEPKTADDGKIDGGDELAAVKRWTKPRTPTAEPDDMAMRGRA